MWGLTLREGRTVNNLIPRSHDQANIEQSSSKYEACIKHSLHEANIEQMSS